MCFVVLSTEVSHDHVVAVMNFLLESGRTGAAVLLATRALSNTLRAEMSGRSKRLTPLYSSAPLGSVGQAQSRLYAGIRALRLQLEHGYPVAITSEHLVTPRLILHT